MKRTRFTPASRSLKKLQEQIPSDLTQLTSAEMKHRFPKDCRRRCAPTFDILRYWENTFRLDWGEPECFACKNLTFRPEKSEWLIQELDKYQPEEKIPDSVWSFGWSFERCHIVSACFGGPGQAWNIVLLCSCCHDELDRCFAGYPNEYYDIIKWLTTRRMHLMKYANQQINDYLQNKKGFTMTLDILEKITEYAESDDAFSSIKNRHNCRESGKSLHGYSMINKVIARFLYGVDQYLKPNKNGPEIV
jgi:5-methylcytosine-specific restriction endonuclease McrA